MIITRKFHTDPGHGWLEVWRSDLKKYGVAGKITPYSYQKNGKVYLEEDCDLTAFDMAVRVAGDKLEFIQLPQLEGTHWIRLLDSYHS